jgi:polyisoprenoid-binding protein YceI
MKIIFFILSLISISNFSAYAEKFEINKDHSTLKFKIVYMTLSEVEGFFSKYSGNFEFEEKNHDLKNLNFVVKTSSISTLDSKRDNHLNRADFFNTQRFPDMTFTSRSIKKLSAKEFEVLGDLTLKGITKPVILKTQFLGSQVDHVHKKSIFFRGEALINRQDFGMSWNKSLDKGEFLLGDKVKIDFTIQAQPYGKKTAYSTHLVPATKPLEDIARAKRGEIPYPIIEPDAPKDQSAQFKVENVKAVVTSPDQIDAKDLWFKGILGFFGFCAVVIISYFFKIQMIKIFKKETYEEISWFSYAGDTFVILVTFIYAVWFWNFMFSY